MFASPGTSSGIVSMLSDDVVFSVENEDYRWQDVVVAAVRWGEWTIGEHRARQGYAAVKHAEATGDPVSSAALDAASREFRYARDLVTAHSMEQWLLKRDVTARDWTNYLRRDLNRARWPDELDVLVEQYPLSDADAARLTLTDAIFSGGLDRWSRALAARVAAVQGLRRPAPATAPIDFPSVVTDVISADPSAIHRTARRIQEIDEAFEQFRATQITEPVLREFITTRQLDWVRFDCRSMAFPEEDMAAEAALLLREDGEGFTGVYSVAHTIPQVTRFYSDRLEGSLRDQFMAACTGDLVGPARVNDEYVLYLVQEKVLPTVRDPEVRRRAEEGVLEHALSQQLDHRVRWNVGA